MATFDKHKQASTQFHDDVADSGIKAVAEVGAALKNIGARMAGNRAVEQPRQIVTDVILEMAKVHAKFRERALDAASKALKIVR